MTKPIVAFRKIGNAPKTVKRNIWGVKTMICCSNNNLRVGCVGKRERLECWWGNQKARQRLVGLAFDVRIILKWVLKQRGRGRGLY